MTPSELRAQILAQASAEPAPTRRQSRVRQAAAAVLAAVVSLGLFVGAGGVRPTHRPVQLLLGTATGAAVLAIVAAWAAIGRGRSMVGRPSRILVALLVAVPVSLFAWKVGWTGRFAGSSVRWPDRVGLRCLVLSLATGAAPIVLLLAGRRRSDPVHPALTGASLGVAVGALTWFLVDLWCPVGYVPHLLLGHVLPIALFVGAGAIAGRSWLGVRA